MMKRIHEQRLHDTIPASLRRWLLGNDENHHLVEPAPPIKGEGRRVKIEVVEKTPPGKTVQGVLF
jgi:hypothetical protein